MATDRIMRDSIACISPHKDFDEDPTSSLTNTWEFIGAVPNHPMPQHERIVIPRFRASRQQYYKDTFISDYGVAQSFTIPEHDVAKANLPLWLMAYFQKVANSGAGVFTHAFTPLDPSPDFAADAGYLLHYMHLGPSAGQSWIAANCIVTQLVIRIGKNDRGNRLTIEPTLLPRKIYPLDDAHSETLNYPTETFWQWNYLTGDIDDSYFNVQADSPELYSLELTLANNGGGRNQDGYGRPVTFVMPEYTMEGVLRILKRASDSDGFIADWLGDTMNTIMAAFETTSGSATSGDMQILVQSKLTEGASHEEGDVQEMIYNFPFVGLQTAADAGIKIDTHDTTATIESLFT